MGADVSALLAEARKAARAVYVAVDATVAGDLSRMLNGLADALEAATPRVVRTVEDLDALPRLSVVLDNRWDIWRVTEPGRASRIDSRHGEWADVHWDTPAGFRGFFPATVLFVPSTENR